MRWPLLFLIAAASPQTAPFAPPEDIAFRRADIVGEGAGNQGDRNLRGAPVRAKFVLYDPVEDLGKAPRCAMQFVIAEKEERFDNRDRAIKADRKFTAY